MSLHRIFAFSLLTVSATAMADSVDINLSNDTAQLQYSTPVGNTTLGKSEFHVGVLYADKDNMVGDFGILVKDEVGSSAPGLSAGLGVKGLVATAENQDAEALALGGQVRYSPPGASRLGLVGQLYFAPDIVTFGDADRYLETEIRVEYEAIPQAVIYLGQRRIRVGLEAGPTVTLDKSVYAGLRLSF